MKYEAATEFLERTFPDYKVARYHPDIVFVKSKSNDDGFDIILDEVHLSRSFVREIANAVGEYRNSKDSKKKRNKMDTENYEKIVVETAAYPKSGEGEVIGLAYTALGLNGEAGEIAEKIKKLIRDSSGVLVEETRQALLKELGDVQWYLAALARELKSSVGEIMEMNMQKLRARKENNTIHGSGDDR